MLDKGLMMFVKPPTDMKDGTGEGRQRGVDKTSFTDYVESLAGPPGFSLAKATTR